MHWRILLSVPTVLVVWWFGWRISMPGPDNWLIWLMTADTAAWWRSFWLAAMFTGAIAIIASLCLFAKKNTLAFIGVTVVAYVFAWLYAMGSKASGHIMDPRDFASLLVALDVTYPLLFTDLVRGRQ